MCMYLLSKQVTGQLSLSCFHSVKNPTPFCIPFLPEIIPSFSVSKATAFFLYAGVRSQTTTTQTSLKLMAFAQNQE